MLKNKIKGSGVAIITPFKDDLSIDFESLEIIINHIIINQTDFIVVLGTTGEASLLTNDERRMVREFIREKVDGRIPLVLGYGGIDTREMIEGMTHTDFSGFTAILTVTPYYVKPSQKGIIEHYKAIADASPIPVILYNVPGRTGVNMEVSTTLELSKHPNIAGIKEASGKLFQIEDILMRKPEDFIVLSGDDALTFHFMNLGADGVISVIANAFPKEISDIVHFVEHDKGNRSLELHNRLKPITKSIFLDGNPAGVKYLMSKLNLCSNKLRLPLVPVSKGVADIIDNELSLILNCK